MNIEDEKRLAALQTAELVADGMAVGLGAGTTVAHLLPRLAARDLRIHCVATSPRPRPGRRRPRVESFDRLDRLDIAIDGADQVAAGWSRVASAPCSRKIVAAAAGALLL